MGWSCRHEAGETMRAILAFDNPTFKADDGHEYFIEISNREHDDGHITGTVYRVMVAGETACINGEVVTLQEFQSGFCRKAGRLSINPDGTIKELPAVYKRALKATGYVFGQGAPFRAV